MDLIAIAGAASLAGMALCFGGLVRRDATATAVGLFVLGIAAAFALFFIGISIDDR